MTYLLPTTIDVSAKGQVLIPVLIRRALGIKPKGKVILFPKIKRKRLIVEPVEEDPIEAACGLFATKDGESWTEELLKERKKDLKKEERGL